MGFFLMTLTRLFANEVVKVRHWIIILWLESMVDDVVGPVLADS